METIEMKKINEDILNKWRNYGMLSGLKEGSTNEWRCAKSFDEMANFLLNNNEELLLKNTDFEIVIFPIIRRLLCTNKNRLLRIVHPEEIIKALNETSIKEAFDIVDVTNPIKGTTGLKYVGRKLTRNFAEKFCIAYSSSKNNTYETMTCIDMINSWNNEELQEKIKFFQDITSSNFEAEMCCIFSEVIKEKLKQ